MLYAEGSLTTIKGTMKVLVLGSSPKVMGRVATPTGVIASLVMITRASSWSGYSLSDSKVISGSPLLGVSSGLLHEHKLSLPRSCRHPRGVERNVGELGNSLLGSLRPLTWEPKRWAPERTQPTSTFDLRASLPLKPQW
ncbi:hypothetical protein GW17_00050682 [Ensete ventricosum]|nr:hypothetical protein GW17_00050682 [Ensete ventricosum]